MFVCLCVCVCVAYIVSDWLKQINKKKKQEIKMRLRADVKLFYYVCLF